MWRYSKAYFTKFDPCFFPIFSIKSARIPDDVLPPRAQIHPSSGNVSVTVEAKKSLKRKRKLQKLDPEEENKAENSQEIVLASSSQAETSNNLLTLLESGKYLLLEDGQQLMEITEEQAQQLGIQNAE